MTTPRSRAARPLPILALTAIASLLGGFAAAGFWSLAPGPAALALLAGAVVGTGAALPFLAAPPSPPAAPAPAPPEHKQPVVQSLTSQIPRDPDPHSTVVAQCPRCGDFRLDVEEVAPGYAFRCRNAACGAAWSWTPATPWPPVVVRRNLPLPRNS